MNHNHRSVTCIVPGRRVLDRGYHVAESMDPIPYCAVCIERFGSRVVDHRPHGLPCGHSLCRGCLGTIGCEIRHSTSSSVIIKVVCAQVACCRAGLRRCVRGADTRWARLGQADIARFPRNFTL